MKNLNWIEGISRAYFVLEGLVYLGYIVAGIANNKILEGIGGVVFFFIVFRVTRKAATWIYQGLQKEEAS